MCGRVGGGRLLRHGLHHALEQLAGGRGGKGGEEPDLAGDLVRRQVVAQVGPQRGAVQRRTGRALDEGDEGRSGVRAAYADRRRARESRELNDREDAALGRAGEAGSSKASPAAGKASARGKGKSVDLVSSDSEDGKEQKDGSRHQSVQVSQIYKDWAGIALDATRRRFQTMMMVRDGYPLKTQTPYKVLNYKLVLRAASAVMSAKDAAQFIAQMERAFKDTDKA